MYDVYLSDQYGVRLEYIANASEVSATLTTNAVSAFKATVPSDIVPILRRDHIVEIWREGRLLGGGFLRGWKIKGDVVTLSAPGFLYLLDGRIIEYAAGSSEASKSGAADDLIKAIVRENLGTSATSDRQFDIIVAPDGSAGETVSQSFAWRDVLLVAQDLALESAERGTRVYFGFRSYLGTGLSLQFETAINQWGADRSFTGETPVIFGESLGNLEDYEENYDYWDEINTVYVGGQGVGADRLVEEVNNTSSLNASRWARRERFANHCNVLADTALQSAGRAALYKWRGKETFSAKLINTPSTQFGRHWNWGDRVAIMQNGRKLDGIIDKVSIRFQHGKETLSVRIGGNL